MSKKKKYLGFVVFAFAVILIVAVFELDDDQQVVNAIKHGLKGIFRAL